ncbi:MAG TPA: peptidase M26, partial [[Clostridium] spiroforme]|nr:peptidase M26 [Thomasclavelia spiroformis]
MKAIGTNKIVYENDGDATTFGTGNVVVDNDNNVVTYSLSANYRLMNDIPLNINDLWQLPEDFTGKFVSEDITENPVYDKTSDTIYVYHSYQLQTIASNIGDQEPVMSKDANPELYGMGQLTYIDDNNYVTYSKEHNYVLSKLFTGNRPEMISTIYATNDNAKNDDQKAGRDYVGQIIKEIDGIEYILIGSKEQLFAIGKKEYGGLLTEKRYAQVTGPAYSYSKSKGFTLEYCGDADLELNSNSNENNNGKIIDDGADNGLSPVKWYGVNENGNPSLDCKGKQTTGKYYAPDENYIIFRDIDLENKEWTPLMFSGTMIGAKSNETGGLWANNEIVQSEQAVISNVKINQNKAINIKEQSGV